MSAAHDLLDTLHRQLGDLVRDITEHHADPSAGPAVAAITFTTGRDWSGDEAIHFTVVLRDQPRGGLYELTALTPIRDALYDGVRGLDIGAIPYATFRLESEEQDLAGREDAPDGDESP